MEAAEYEEGYFKLKKSNEEFVTLLNKVINDLKLAKQALKTEKDKNAALSTKNGNLSAELIEFTRKCEDQSKTISDLNQELDYLKSYSKAVEGVAENYCGKSITTQKKYDQLKRQSSIFFSNYPDQSLVDFDLVDTYNESDILDTPVPILEIEEIKINHEELIIKEKEKYENLRKDFIEKKNEIIGMKREIEQLMETIKDKEMNITQLNGELDIMVTSYKNLNDNHDKMMNFFEPFLRIKAENDNLKRTSALLISSVSGDEKMMEFLKVIDNLKTEILDKDNKITNLEMKLIDNDQSTIALELTKVRTELEELTGKLENLKKERDTLKHENRILLEQKGGYGICPPPPPLLPPPPPPPSKIMKIFKNKKKKAPTSTSHSPTEKTQKDVLICNLMAELEKKLLEKVNRKQFEKVPPSSEKNIDVTDNKPNPFKFNLKKQLHPSLSTDQNKGKNELDEVFQKHKEKKIGNSPILKKNLDSLDNPSPFVNLRKKSLPNFQSNMNNAQNYEFGQGFKNFPKKNVQISEKKNDKAQDDQPDISENENKSNQQ